MVDEAEFYTLKKRVDRLEKEQHRYQKKVHKGFADCFTNDKTLYGHIEKLEAKMTKTNR